jgi:hypothetical protein
VSINVELAGTFCTAANLVFSHGIESVESTVSILCHAEISSDSPDYRESNNSATRLFVLRSNYLRCFSLLKPNDGTRRRRISNFSKSLFGEV